MFIRNIEGEQAVEKKEEVGVADQIEQKKEEEEKWLVKINWNAYFI